MKHSFRLLLGTPVRSKLRRKLEQTLQEAQDCQRTQQQTLQRILGLNAQSQFSRDFGLDRAASVADLRNALPVGDYERIAPYVERVKAGDVSALLGPGNEPLMFALTSGTTSASKFIPITRRFLEDYRRGWQCWGIRTFDDHPSLHVQKVFQLTSDFARFQTESQIPCGNISGLVQQMQNPLVKMMYTTPASILKVSPAAAKFYLALKSTLRARELGMITTANPSTLVQLFRLMAEQGENLVRDLRDGTNSCGDEVEGSPRLLFQKDPRRARELDALLNRHGVLRPRDVWPQLALLAVWTGGSAATYLPVVREYCGDLPIRDHGLHASEGRMTIPLEDGTASGVLDIGSHFFEFIPEDEHESPQPTVLQAHELEVGRSYYILLTTVSGLYRYDIRDVVECTGFLGTTPLLRFLHKGSHISSLTGEKLTESHVTSAVSHVMNQTGTRLHYFTVAPQWGDPPRYVLLAEEHYFAHPEQAREFAALVDARLQYLNSEYEEKRQSDRLEPLELVPIVSGAWEEFAAQRQTGTGGSAEQYKHPFLSPRLEFLESFNQTWGLRPAAPQRVSA